MGKILNTDEDCADCLCRVCARNMCNDSYNPVLEHEPPRCICDCGVGDEIVESDEDCPEYLPDL